jgi:hypothetical protein
MKKKKIEIRALCFWCGSEMGIDEREEEEGKIAPERAMVSYIPCRTCGEKFKGGITLFEAQETPFYKDQPPVEMGLDLFPSGRWVTLPQGSALQRAFGNEAAEEVRVAGMGFVSPKAFSALCEDSSGSRPTSH